MIEVKNGYNQLDEASKTVVFDDIRLDAKSLAPIKEYFSAGRHKNVTATYLAQSCYDVPKYIRRNIQLLCHRPDR